MGPLAGVRVLEFQSNGPGPFGAMILADLGAEVIRISRFDQMHGEHSSTENRKMDLVARGRRSAAINLKMSEGLETAFKFVEWADVLIEGYRPGVMERLGLGPEACLERNEALIYARMTGWGQSGPYAMMPGHDINYVALAGALDPLRGGPDEAPRPPLNLLGDYAGGGMLLAVGVLSAVVERSRSGKGQVVDAAMVDGVALLTTLFHAFRAEGLWPDTPGTHTLSLGTPSYNVYKTADDRYVSLGGGAHDLYGALGVADDEIIQQRNDPAKSAQVKQRLTELFRSKTLAQWQAQLEGADACFAPVLTMEEAPHHPHNMARNTFVEVDGVVQPAPAPRFSRTPADLPGSPMPPGGHTNELLRELGLSDDQIAALQSIDAIRQA